MLKRLVNGEIAFGFMFATLFWVAVLGWQTSYAPTEPEKAACYQAAAKSGRSVDECEAFWEKTTSEPIALFTFVLAFSTIGLWIVTWRSGVKQTRDTRDIERAYVKMSHYPPGAMFGTGPSVDTQIEIKNFGNTPARITNVVVNAWVSPKGKPLPEQVTYKPISGPVPGAFLVSNDSFVFFSSVEILETDRAGIRERTRQLHVIGYVDYIDQFGQRHRGGYARKYEAAGPTNNNLVYVPERGYNYDRLRLPGEGGDWDQES
jgi:hypothetical protein